MVQAKAMGIGGMLLFLIVAVTLLPMVVRFIDTIEPHYIVSAFQDMEGFTGSINTPSIPSMGPSMGSSMGSSATNSPFMPSTQHGEQCPEGTFYNGTTCVKTYVGGPVPDTGYFS